MAPRAPGTRLTTRALRAAALLGWLSGVGLAIAAVTVAPSAGPWGSPALAVAVLCGVVAIWQHPKRGYAAGRGPSGLGKVTRDAAPPWRALALLTSAGGIPFAIALAVERRHVDAIGCVAAAVAHGWTLALLSAAERRRREMAGV